MVAALPHPDGSRVTVHDGVVYIDAFVENDLDLVAALTSAEDPAATLHDVLALGSRVLRVAQARLDADVIRGEVDKLTTAFAGTVTTAVDNIAATSARLLDAESGELPTALTAFRAQVEELLGDAFDPDSRSSLLSRIEQAYLKVGEDQLHAFRRLINPEAEDSPLHRWRTEIITQVREQSTTIAEEVRKLADKVIVQQAAERAAAEARELTTAKGFTYEDQLHELIESVAVVHGDLAEQTGRERGVDGTQKGDEVVLLNPEDTRGIAARAVFEVKDTKLGLTKTFEELDAAMANREATVGIAVFSSQRKAPTAEPFVPFDCKAILVVDKDDPDRGAVRLAYTWARWMVRRQLATSESNLNLDRIEGLLDDAKRELTRVSAVRRALSTATKKIGEAGGEVNVMTDNLHGLLDALCEEIGDSA